MRLLCLVFADDNCNVVFCQMCQCNDQMPRQWVLLDSRDNKHTTK